MGINVNISLEKDLNEIKVFLDEFRTKALVNATRKSFNRTVSTLRTRSNKEVREHRKLKAGEINRRFFRVMKARGSRLDRLEASLDISGDPISLIRFVKGDKNPRNQKGIKVKKRKPLKVEVKPGRRVQLKSAFIAKGSGGKNQIFRRRTGKRNPIVKQSVPALSTLFSRDRFRAPLEAFANAKLSQEFERTFEFELDRLAQKRGLK